MKLRFYYLALWIFVVGLGLSSRTYGGYLPSLVATYAGNSAEDANIRLFIYEIKISDGSISCRNRPILIKKQIWGEK